MSAKPLQVMNVQRFCIHDGPGIRTTVFLQGCPLHCPWCANPESQKIGPQLMFTAEKCMNCGRCQKACLREAILPGAQGSSFQRDRCNACGACADVCPQGAITLSGKQMDAEELLHLVLHDRDYYINSGGGLTVSGGEPFAQFDGLMELLRLAKQAGIHTAVETCGHVPQSHFQAAYPLLDHVMLDIKHTDAKRLREVTGGNHALILKNAAWAAAQDAEKLRLRMPVIPGFNNDEETIAAFFKFAVNCGVRRVNLLPYHTLGSNKYAMLGRPYIMADVPMLDKRDLLPFKAMGEASGLSVTIGG